MNPRIAGMTFLILLAFGASASAAEQPRYIGQWGTDLHGKGKFWRPTDIAFDERGMIYVVDSLNARVQIFNPDGSYYCSFGNERFEDFRFQWPISIMIDKDRLYVLDLGWRKVFSLVRWDYDQEKSDTENESPEDQILKEPLLCNYFRPPFRLESEYDFVQPEDKEFKLSLFSEMRLGLSLFLHDFSISCGTSLTIPPCFFSKNVHFLFEMLGFEMLGLGTNAFVSIQIEPQKNMNENNPPFSETESPPQATRNAYFEYLKMAAKKEEFIFVNSDKEPFTVEKSENDLLFTYLFSHKTETVSVADTSTPFQSKTSSESYLFLKEGHDGSIWKVYVFGDRVTKYDRKFNEILSIGIDRAAPGAISGSMMEKGITGIKIAENGTIIVFDVGKNKCMKYSNDNRFISESDCKYSDFTCGDKCEIVRDYHTDIVYTGGKPFDDFNKLKPEVRESLGYYRGFYRTSDGTMYISDSSNDRIVVVDLEGNLITTFGSEGVGPGEFQNPIGIAVDSEGYIYVVDNGNERVQKFSPIGR